MIKKVYTPEYIIAMPDTLSNIAYPLVVFFHGMGGNGTNLDLLVNGELPKEIQYAVNNKEFICIAPQNSRGWNRTENQMEFVLNIADQLPVDMSNIHLTGLSLGCQMVWGYPTWNERFAMKIKSIVAVCGVGGAEIGDYAYFSHIKKIRAYHAKNDGVVSWQTSKNIIDKINSYPRIQKAELIDVPGMPDNSAHYIWGKVYGNEFDALNWALDIKGVTPVDVPPSFQNEFTIDGDEYIKTPLTELKLTNVNIPKYTTQTRYYWKIVSAPVNLWTPIMITGGGWYEGTIQIRVKGNYIMSFTIEENGTEVLRRKIEIDFV